MIEEDEPAEPKVGEGLEIEREWSEARAARRMEPSAPGAAGEAAALAGPGALLSPYLILYAGFFLGPASAFASSLFVGPRDLSVRRISFMLGICGAAWCAIQGMTVLAAPFWSDTGVQMLRSSFNFSGSALLVIFWRSESPGRFAHSRRAIVASILVGCVLLAFFAFLPGSALLFLGR